MLTREQFGEKLAEYAAKNEQYGATYSDMWNMCIRGEAREIETSQVRFIRTSDDIGMEVVLTNAHVALDNFRWGPEAIAKAQTEIARLSACVLDHPLTGSWLTGFGGDIAIFRGNLLRVDMRMTVMSIYGEVLYRSAYVSHEEWTDNGGIQWGHSEAVRLCNALISGEIQPRANEFDLGGLG